MSNRQQEDPADKENAREMESKLRDLRTQYDALKAEHPSLTVARAEMVAPPHETVVALLRAERDALKKRLEEAVLAGKHGEWRATDNHVHTETDWESEDDVCDHPRMDGDQCAECGDRCSHRDVGAVADGVCHDHECPIHGTAA